MPRTRALVIVGMVLAAAVSRLLPHLPNFTPIAAMALFGGARLADRRLAFLVPLAALFLSDLVIGLHAGMPFVYGSFALIVGLGLRLRERRSALPIAGAALAGSLLFFVVTNFGTWAVGGIYPRTPAGLAACYLAAIPFFGPTLAGDAIYTTLLFGGLALAVRWVPALTERRVPALPGPGQVAS